MDRVVVTLREAIFSVTIASVLLFAGFMISARIEHGVNQRNLRYRQAASVSTPEGFSLAMRTDVGDAFVEADFRALDTVSHDKLGGEWLWLTEVYWTWDTYKVEKRHSKRVSYIGEEFPYEKFDYSWVGRKFKTVDNGFMLRIEFTYLPTRFRASAFTSLSKGTVTNGTGLRQGMSIDKLYEACTKSYAVGVFWTFWIMLIVGAVVGFVVLDNRWIEDKPEEFQ